MRLPTRTCTFFAQAREISPPEPEQSTVCRHSVDIARVRRLSTDIRCLAALIGMGLAAPLFGMSSAVLADGIKNIHPKGQLFCKDESQIDEYVKAGLAKNEAWMKQVTGCLVLKPGLPYTKLADRPPLPLMEVSKVRVFSPDMKNSMVGFLVSIASMSQ